MLTLLLLRHAKSSWEGRAKDFERPLAPRGERAAPGMGAYLVAQGLLPELILCSSATRTRQTLALVLPHLSGQPEVMVEDGLYLATSTALLSRLRRVGSGIVRVMMIGHNPGMHGLATMLSGSGEEKALKALGAKFPTAALAAITFAEGDWSQIAPASGRLTHFMTPKRLP
jgi:phosphohistidine phosphatase